MTDPAQYMRRVCNRCSCVGSHVRDGSQWQCENCLAHNPDSDDLLPKKGESTEVANRRLSARAATVAHEPDIAETAARYLAPASGALAASEAKRRNGPEADARQFDRNVEIARAVNDAVDQAVALAPVMPSNGHAEDDERAQALRERLGLPSLTTEQAANLRRAIGRDEPAPMPAAEPRCKLCGDVGQSMVDAPGGGVYCTDGRACTRRMGAAASRDDAERRLECAEAALADANGACERQARRAETADRRLAELTEAARDAVVNGVGSTLIDVLDRQAREAGAVLSERAAEFLARAQTAASHEARTHLDAGRLVYGRRDGEPVTIEAREAGAELANKENDEHIATIASLRSAAQALLSALEAWARRSYGNYPGLVTAVRDARDAVVSVLADAPEAKPAEASDAGLLTAKYEAARHRANVFQRALYDAERTITKLRRAAEEDARSLPEAKPAPDPWLHKASSGREPEPALTPEAHEQLPDPPSFRDDIASAINRHSVENASNTPDFILAGFVAASLDAFAATSREREHWYGKPLSIGGDCGRIAEPWRELEAAADAVPTLKELHGRCPYVAAQPYGVGDFDRRIALVEAWITERDLRARAKALRGGA